VEYTGVTTDKNQLRSWAKATYEPNGSSELHYHQEQTEDYYIISGSGTLMLDSEKLILSPGTHFRINPLQQHQVINNSDKEELILLVKCTPAWQIQDLHLVQTRSFAI
jgi:mannose-6-phosphate isomerase-like protein (cupin superfamily)